MRIHRLFLPLLLSLNGSCTLLLVPDASRSERLLEVVGAASVEGSAGLPLAQPVTFRVVDGKGRPVANELVQFSVSGGVVSSGRQTTSALGTASVTWTLGPVAGAQTLTARLQANQNERATVDARVRPGPLARLERIAGDGQIALEGSVLPDSLVVRAEDEYGNPIPGVAVTWRVPAGGGTLSPTGTTVTRADGTARTAWSVGIDLPNRATASAGLHTVQFSATASPRPPRVWVEAWWFGRSPPVQFLEFRTGTGNPILPGQVASIFYTAYRPDGTIYQRVRRGADPPLQFRYNVSMLTVLPALNAGIAGMAQGGARRIWIPQEHTDGAGTLYFEVELDQITP